MSSPPFDFSKAHRWFGIELNNRAWDLIESPARTADEIAELLAVAHTSRFHWFQVGTPLNRLRCELLVAAAYQAAHQPDLALIYAQRARQLCEQPDIAATPFDRASVCGALALAFQSLGQREAALNHYQQALAVVATSDHADDRAVFERFYPAP